MTDSIILISHVLGTLPTEIHRRRAVLNALVCTLPKGQIPPDLRTMLGDLDRHLLSENQLRLDLSSDGASKGSARLGDTPIERRIR